MRLARCLPGAVALSLVLGVASARAGGPGVTVFSKASPQPLTLSGAQIAAAPDVPPTRYTLRASLGSAGSKITLSGLSIRGLLVQAGVDPDTIRFVSIVRANGSLLALTRADIADPPPFPEGPALIADSGGRTRFFRPVRDLKGTNAGDVVDTTSAGPLLVSVDGYVSLVLKPSASRTKVTTGQNVTFSVRLPYPPPGARLSYHWEFSDGFTADTRQVTHAFQTPGALQAQVTVSGTGGSDPNCASVCVGVAAVDVQVGEAAPQPDPTTDTTPGAGTGNPQAPGTAAGTGGGGQGGSGGSTGTGVATNPAPAPRPKPKPEPKPAARVPAARPDTPAPSQSATPLVTGVLLSGQPVALTGELPRPRAASTKTGGSAEGPPATRGAAMQPGRIGGGIALVLGVVGLGALSERRRVRLRVA